MSFCWESSVNKISNGAKSGPVGYLKPPEFLRTVAAKIVLADASASSWGTFMETRKTYPVFREEAPKSGIWRSGAPPAPCAAASPGG